MRRKCGYVLLIAIMLFQFGVQSPFIHAAGELIEPNSNQSVLLLYDSLAERTTRAGNIDSLKRLLAAYGMQVTVESFDHYRSGMISNYTKVIGVQNTPDISLSSSDFNKDLEQFSGSYLHIGLQVPTTVRARLGLIVEIKSQQVVQLSIEGWVQSSISIEQLPYIKEAEGVTYGTIQADQGMTHYPYAVERNGYAYVPYYEAGNLSEVAIGYVLRDWLSASGEKHMYLVFKEIYPFSDLKQLKYMADMLYAAGIPFVASVRPVFSNQDYPAMDRYVETLEYLQSRNGSILVHAPVISTTISNDYSILQAQMESFIDVLVQNGVVPLGIGAELYWSFDHYYADYGMKMFDSAVLFPDERIISRVATRTSKPFASAPYSMKPELFDQFEYEGPFEPEMAMDSVISYDFSNEKDKLDSIIDKLKARWIVFDDYKATSHHVKTANSQTRSDQGLLYIHDQQVDMSDTFKEISQAYEYREKEKKSFVALFNVQNQIFIVLILVSLLLFTILFIVGRALYKRKYFNG